MFVFRIYESWATVSLRGKLFIITVCPLGSSHSVLNVTINLSIAPDSSEKLYKDLFC